MKIFPNCFAQFLLLSLSLLSCNNLEDASPDNRKSFYHAFGGSTNFYGKVVEIDGEGFIAGADSVASNGVNAIVIKTDKLGNPIWRKMIKDASVNAIKVVTDGYLIFGDGIQYIDSVQQVDKVKSKARLIKMDLNGNIKIDKVWGDNSPDTRVDFQGTALTLNGDTLISTINFKKPGSNQITILAAHSPVTLDTFWTQSYYLLDRDLINGKAVSITSSKDVIWASSAVAETQAAKASYLNVPVVKPNSTFVNAARFGQTDDAFYSGADVKQSAVGFGVVGTFSSKTGTNSNLYFVKLDPSGNIVTGSELYFDASLSQGNIPIPSNNKTNSETQDTGDALAVTSDGGYLLAGSMTTTATAGGDIGNGGTDIYLVRLDPFGTVLWTKIIGGTGNESVACVRQTSDGGFVICGTNNLNELSSVILFKTDRNGEFRE